jgi:hypothetical protein
LFKAGVFSHLGLRKASASDTVITGLGGSAGIAEIYADMTGPMDTIIWELEAASLDKFYQLERGVFINPDAATQNLIDNLNGSAVEGRRDIFEVIV